MIEGPIKPDTEFRHIRDETHYIVLNGTHTGEANETLAIVKIGHAGPKQGWVMAIVYYDPTDSTRLFVRDEETFRENFERVGHGHT